MNVPSDLAVLTRWIIFPTQHGDVVIGRLGATELEDVNLRTGLMARQKVVDRMEDAHSGERQRDLKCGPSSRRRAGDNAAIVEDYDLLDQGETEPRAVAFRRKE